MTLFPFADYWWFYGLFLLFVLFMLALDLGVFNRKAHVVTFKEATVWSVVWVALALTFNFLFYQYTLSAFGAETARQAALEFLSGYVVEYYQKILNTNKPQQAESSTDILVELSANGYALPIVSAEWRSGKTCRIIQIRINWRVRPRITNSNWIFYVFA